MTAARIIADTDAPSAQPGDLDIRSIDGEVWGYGFRCPGCGSRSYVGVRPNEPDGWTVTAGDRATATGMSLTPSILNRCCGWHGYMTAGQWVKC